MTAAAAAPPLEVTISAASLAIPPRPPTADAAAVAAVDAAPDVACEGISENTLVVFVYDTDSETLMFTLDAAPDAPDPPPADATVLGRL